MMAMPAMALNTRRLCLGALALTLAACASVSTLTADVATFGEWPAARSGGSYAFDRLPSQQAQNEAAQAAAALEAAAQGALARAGFKPAAAGQAPDIVVQLAARLSRTAPVPWADPWWWRGGFGPVANPWRGSWVSPYGPGIAPAWAWHARADTRRYEREVAMLIREGASGKPLYEARASLESFNRGDADTLAALFTAALQEFPKVDGKPHPVTVATSP